MRLPFRGMRNAFRNLLRLCLTVGMLGASLMFVAAMIALNNSATNQLARAQQQIGTGIDISPAGNTAGPTFFAGPSDNGQGSSNSVVTPAQGTLKTIDPTTLKTLKNTKGVTRSEEYVSINEQNTVTDNKGNVYKVKMPAPTSFGNGPAPEPPEGSLTVRGVSTNATRLGGGPGTQKIVQGKGFSADDTNKQVALIGEELAKKLGLKVGDTLQIKGKTFTIQGIFSSQDSVDNTILVVIPIGTAQTLFKIDGVHSLTVYAATYDQVSALADRLRKSVTGKALDVVTNDQMFKSTIDALKTTQSSVLFSFLISVAITALVIVFAVILIVRERSTEIGTLKALGASHWQVIRQFVAEVITYNGLAAVLGLILLAIFGQSLAEKFTPAAANNAPPGGNAPAGAITFIQTPTLPGVDTHLTIGTFNVQTLIAIFGTALILAIVASAIPAFYVSLLRPATVLRKANL